MVRLNELSSTTSAKTAENMVFRAFTINQYAKIRFFREIGCGRRYYSISISDGGVG